MDPTRTIKPKQAVVIRRVDLVFLEKQDWKYEGSTAGSGGGGRTHTFGVKLPATKLKGAAAYELPGIALKGGRPVLAAIGRG